MKFFCVFFLSLILIACNNSKPADSSPEPEPKAEEQVESQGEMDWLLGKWKRLNEEEGKTTLEFWEKESASVYKGIGFTLQNGDTIKKENIHLAKIDDTWDLTVKVLNEDPVTFAGVENSSKRFTVKNDSIPFPNTIKYWMVGDTLKANVANADFKISFDFVKVN